MKTWSTGLAVLLALMLSACGYKLGYRHLSGPIKPVEDLDRSADFAVGDDGSITFVKDRLEVSLLPMSVDMLNRSLPSNSTTPEGFHRPNPYVEAKNPYTYGDWKPGWEEEKPERFTVFLLRVKNYQYPKVLLYPYSTEITAPNGRRYQAFSQAALAEYYAPYAVGYAGNTFHPSRERLDALNRTLYPEEEMVFSGQETEGNLVFYTLDHDVEDFTVQIKGMVLRFDYRGQPIETIDITYRFTRDVYLARKPRTEEQ